MSQLTILLQHTQAIASSIVVMAAEDIAALDSRLLQPPFFWISVLALIVVPIVFFTGYMLGKRRSRKDNALTDAERKKMLDLIHEIGTWTNEYSGKVTQYQQELGELSRSVRQNPKESPRVAETSQRIVHLLQQFMQNNGQLQQKLDAAEFQLDQKTRQIECYLTEARTDSLTGLLNRRAFDQRLEELFEAHRDGGCSFVVALIDVDHFKGVNDTHGHQAGDDALKLISKLLADRLSDTEMVARFGGEEFAVIMKEPLTEAARRLDDIRSNLEMYGLNLADIQLNNTISVGLSEPHGDNGPGPLVRRADEALYAAKNFGRNRVYYHDGQAPTLVGSPETAKSQ